jgi:hypothetical protein
MLKTTLSIYCVFLFMDSLVISVPVMGAEYNYEVSGSVGESRKNQSGIGGLRVIGGIVQHPGQEGVTCRVVKTRRACKILCSNGVVRACKRG